MPGASSLSSWGALKPELLREDDVWIDLMSPVLLGEEAPRSCWERQTEGEKKKERKEKRESLEKHS